MLMSEMARMVLYSLLSVVRQSDFCFVFCALKGDEYGGATTASEI